MSGTTAPLNITISTVPLQGTPETLAVSLSATVYNLTVKWNWQAQLWVVDIADVNDIPIVGGIPLITGIDLLGQYAYLGINGSLVVDGTGSANDPPTFTNLGKDANLLFVSPPPP